MPRDPKALAAQRVTRAVVIDRKAEAAHQRTQANLRKEVARAAEVGMPKYQLSKLAGKEWHTIQKWCRKVRAEKEGKG